MIRSRTHRRARSEAQTVRNFNRVLRVAAVYPEEIDPLIWFSDRFVVRHPSTTLRRRNVHDGMVWKPQRGTSRG
jgi:hypothetical protein